MRRKKILATLLCAAVIGSCKKEKEISPGLSHQPATASMPQTRSAEGKQLQDYLNYEGNEAQTRMNISNFFYLKGMQKVFAQNPEKLIHMYNKIKMVRRNGLFLTAYINGSGNCAESFNASVAKIHPKGTEISDYVSHLCKNMEYENMRYEPVICLYNGEHANLTGDYYLALAVEDMDEDESNEGREYIPALHVSGNDVSLELINHYDAYFQSAPVFLFTDVIKQEYDFMGGKVMPPPVNEADPETFHVYAVPDAYTLAVLAGEGRGGSPTQPASPPPPPPVGDNMVFHESVNLTAHYEQYYDSEFAICYRVDKHSGASDKQEQIKLADVRRNYVDCGCYWYLGGTFINDFSNAISFKLITYEHDGWSIPAKDFTFNDGQKLYFKARYYSEIYNVEHYAVTASEFPNVGSAKHLVSGTSNYILRRK